MNADAAEPGTSGDPAEMCQALSNTAERLRHDSPLACAVVPSQSGLTTDEVGTPRAAATGRLPGVAGGQNPGGASEACQVYP